MQNQQDMPKSVRDHMTNKMIGKKIDDLIICKILGSGNTAITYEVEDIFGVRWALKLVTRESYGERAQLREYLKILTIK